MENRRTTLGAFFPTSALLMVMLALTSCSNELTRDDAKDLLVEKYSFPYVEFENMQMLGNVSPKRGQDNVPAEAANGFGQTEQRWISIAPLVDAGLLVRGNGRRVDVYTAWGAPKRYGPSLTYTFTSLTNKYLQPGSRINTDEDGRHRFVAMVCEVHLGEVTGIKFDDAKTTAQVEYTIERKNFSPFQLLWVYPKPDREAKTAVFELYDDGWRLKDAPQQGNMSVSAFKAQVKSFVAQAEEVKKRQEEDVFVGDWISVTQDEGSVVTDKLKITLALGSTPPTYTIDWSTDNQYTEWTGDIWIAQGTGHELKSPAGQYNTIPAKFVYDAKADAVDFSNMNIDGVQRYFRPGKQVPAEKGSQLEGGNNFPKTTGSSGGTCDVCAVYYGERKRGLECIRIEPDGSFKHFWRCTDAGPANYGTWSMKTYQGRSIIALEIPGDENKGCWQRHDDCRLSPGQNGGKRSVQWNDHVYTEK